jgi:hypothetical protein
VPEHSTSPPLVDVVVLADVLPVVDGLVEVVLVDPPVPPDDPAIPVAALPPQAAMSEVTPSAARYRDDRRSTSESGIMRPPRKGSSVPPGVGAFIERSAGCRTRRLVPRSTPFGDTR